jgi:hypothetical protein
MEPMRLPSIAVSVLLTAGFALAQDPPSRVARLNFMDGNVSYQPAGLDQWGAASLNYPLTTGDHIYSDIGSHAEMHIGPNALRLGSQSNFGYLNLDDRTVQVRFTEGALEIRLRRVEDDELYEVDTPQGAISLLRTGEYRIETDPNRNATMVTVRAGEVEVTANGAAFAVHPRQTAYFADGQQPDIRDANPPDAFDEFTNARNMEEDRIPPPVHVPPTMIGYQDLDANGVWRNDGAYGWVWIPRVQPGWAPYRHGHWAFVEPWGWTWIDNASWGFAPFHYGRWVNLGGVWAWVPGNPAPRPVYSPALVAFVGGAGFGVGVAWFPLGPREPFIPAYHVSEVYVRQVNITQVNVTNVNVTNVRYVNQGVPGAVTSVSTAAFVGSRSVAAEARVAGPRDMASAQVMSSPGIAPQRESVLGSGGRPDAVVPHPPQAMMARQVMSKSPVPAAPVRFEAKQQALQENAGRPLAPEQLQQIRSQHPEAARGGQVGTEKPMNAPAPPPVNRMDSRPPNAVRPAPENRAVPAEVQRPAPEIRPAPAAENKPAAANEKKPAAKKAKKTEKEKP